MWSVAFFVCRQLKANLDVYKFAFVSAKIMCFKVPKFQCSGSVRKSLHRIAAHRGSMGLLTCSAEHGHCSNARAISETIFTLRSRFSIHVYSVPLWNWSIDPWLPSGKHTKKYGKSPFLRGKSTISMAIFNSKLLNYQRVAWTQPGMITSPLRKRKNGTPTTSKPMFFVFSWIIIISISQKLIMNFVIFLFFLFCLWPIYKIQSFCQINTMILPMNIMCL